MTVVLFHRLPTGQVNVRRFELILPGICKDKGQVLRIVYPAVIRWLVSRKTHFVSSNNAVITSWTTASSRDKLCHAAAQTTTPPPFWEGFYLFTLVESGGKACLVLKQRYSLCFRVQSTDFLIFQSKYRWGGKNIIITSAAVKSRTPEDGLRRHSYYLLTRKSHVSTVADRCNEIASLRRW